MIQQGTGPDLPRHNFALDGVRGTAIGLVLIFHLLWSNNATGNRWVDGLTRLRESTWIGVDLFYALSGFLITGILFESLGKRRYFTNFYARRILRITPLYYAVVIGMVAYLRFHSRDAGMARPFALLLVYLNNTPLWFRLETAGVAPRLIALTNHLWSLAVEEQFYLVWPFVIFAVKDRRRLMWVAAGLAVMAPVTRTLLLAHGASYEETYKLTLCRMDSLLGGAWLALAIRGPARDRVLQWAPLCFAAAALACLGILLWTGNFDYEVNKTVNQVGYSLVALASTSWIAMTLSVHGVAGVMTWGWLRSLGKYSYGIYVLHMPVSAALDKWLAPALHAQIASRLLFHLASMLLAVAMTVGLAMISFWAYEKRFLGLKRFFEEAENAPAHPA